MSGHRTSGLQPVNAACDGAGRARVPATRAAANASFRVTFFIGISFQLRANERSPRTPGPEPAGSSCKHCNRTSVGGGRLVTRDDVLQAGPKGDSAWLLCLLLLRFARTTSSLPV